MAELALVPFKPISEWTGIDPQVFPEMIDLEGGQWERVNEAIFKVFETLHIELIDAPEDIPPEMLYDVLTTNWDYPVQYLPSSGFDLELCTYDPKTCPYGDYCNCGEDSDFPIDDVPYENTLVQSPENLVKEIAEMIDCGMICFLNPDTREMVSVPVWIFDGTFSADADPFEEDFDRVDTQWERFIRIEPLESHESFRIMEEFSEAMPDRKIQQELFNALNRRKPFANFKELIDNSPYRQDWFDFKQEKLEEHVRMLLESEK